MYVYIENWKDVFLALAGGAQWTEYRPEKPGVTGLIPSQGTCLGCRPGPQWGARQEATTHWCFSSSLSPSLPLWKEINKILKKTKQKIHIFLLWIVVWKSLKAITELLQYTYIYFSFAWSQWSLLGFSFQTTLVNSPPGNTVHFLFKYIPGVVWAAGLL